MIFADYIEQMNKLVEIINYASDAYWGDPEKFSFRARIDSYATTTELSQGQLVVASAGIVDYMKGEVIITTVNITSTQRDNNIVEIQAFPDSNDVIGLKDLYLSFAVGDSTINMVKDTITSGEQISGVGYKITSSYANGALVRG